jgi:hypothetical protein
MSYVRHTIDYQGKLIEIGVTRTVLNSEWGVKGTDAEVEALMKISSTIISNHDFNKPLESEYLFESAHSETSLARMIDWLQRNKL